MLRCNLSRCLPVNKMLTYYNRLPFKASFCTFIKRKRSWFIQRNYGWFNEANTIINFPPFNSWIHIIPPATTTVLQITRKKTKKSLPPRLCLKDFILKMILTQNVISIFANSIEIYVFIWRKNKVTTWFFLRNHKFPF